MHVDMLQEIAGVAYRHQTLAFEPERDMGIKGETSEEKEFVCLVVCVCVWFT